MISLLIIGLLVLSLAIGKKEPKLAAVLDFIVGVLILFFRVIPGTADILDWICMIAFFLMAPGLFFKEHFENMMASRDKHTAKTVPPISPTSGMKTIDWSQASALETQCKNCNHVVSFSRSTCPSCGAVVVFNSQR
jgi:hypothetical protein